MFFGRSSSVLLGNGRTVGIALPGLSPLPGCLGKLLIRSPDSIQVIFLELLEIQ
jgi:hypothetical protein